MSADAASSGGGAAGVADCEARWRAADRGARSGAIELIVVRIGDGAHVTPARVVVTPKGGIEGDRWAAAAKRDARAEISLIDRRVVDAIAGDDPARRHLAGDNLVVDFELSAAALPVGARL